jgi:hypothetical protein
MYWSRWCVYVHTNILFNGIPLTTTAVKNMKNNYCICAKHLYAKKNGPKKQYSAHSQMTKMIH